MDLAELSRQIKTESFQNNFEKVIPLKTRDILNEMSISEIEKLLNEIFTDTVNLKDDISWLLYESYYIFAWYDLFNKLSLPTDMSIYEIATGDIIYVPQALDIYSAKRGKYITLNLNKELSQNFISKTANLDVNIRIIADNGINILNYYNENTFTVVAFQHAINDIIQTIVAEIEGIDTLNNNWWQIEPQMLRAVYTRYKTGKLKDTVYEKFIDIIKMCYQSLEKDGYMIFNNCTFNNDYNEDDYSLDFHSLYINMAREWIAEADLGLDEINIKGYESKWWMILKKK